VSDRRPLKVLQIIDTLSMGGAETWLMEVLRLWAKNGIGQMDFLLTSGNRGIFDAEAEELGANLHYLRYGRKTLPSFLKGFRRILRTGGYDAVHDHQDLPAGWHFLMGGHLLPRIRVVHVHNPSFGLRHTYGVTLSRRVAARLSYSFVARHATHLTGTSRQILTEYGFDAPQFDALPKAALHCGFDPARFAGSASASKGSLNREFDWPQDAKIILVAGRIDESPNIGHSKNHKNSGFAVDVILACMKRSPQLRAVFAGKASPALPVLEQRIATAGMAGRFAFPGVRTDIARMMLGADLLLFPSRGEGLGMVAVEAQAAGLPVLASTAVPRECVVIPELVAFRDIADGPEAWADAVLRMMELPRNVSSANARVAASPFAIENSAQSLVALYRAGELPPAR
jgi:glycosyltransferase involved in cell wall biosynthesis